MKKLDLILVYRYLQADIIITVLSLNLSLRSLNIVVITTNCKVGNTIEGMQQMQY
jgi:hypothetical protein